MTYFFRGFFAGGVAKLCLSFPVEAEATDRALVFSLDGGGVGEAGLGLGTSNAEDAAAVVDGAGLVLVAVESCGTTASVGCVELGVV